jgi:hypothetical protein
MATLKAATVATIDHMEITPKLNPLPRALHGPGSHGTKDNHWIASGF